MVHSASKIFQNIFLYKSIPLQGLYSFLWFTSMIYCSLLSCTVNHPLLWMHSILSSVMSNSTLPFPRCGMPLQYPQIDLLHLKSPKRAQFLFSSFLSFLSFQSAVFLQSTYLASWCQFRLHTVHPPSLNELEF